MRNVKIGITSLATFESIKPPYNLIEPSVQTNLELGLSLLDTAGKNKVDIAVLPETFAYAGISGKKIEGLAEEFPGKCIEAVAKKAAEYSMYVVAGFYVHIDGVLRNVAILFDRSGKITGTYVKQYTTQGEISAGIIPSDTNSVFETDFGKIGIAICFDINWSEIWSTFEGNADLVFWISAYEGGFPLEARAWLHRVPIVSSVMSYHSKMIDISGKVLQSTSRWNRMVIANFNLDREIFHVDNQYSKIQQLQQKYGEEIAIESFTEEHYFIVESLSANLTIKKIIEENGLVTFKDYITQSTKVVATARI
jgi:predicted amidohydrolase